MRLISKYKINLILIIFLVSSCFSNDILLKSHQTFNNLYTNNLSLEVKPFNKKLGYQYLFFAFPFSKNILKNTTENLLEVIDLELYANGYHRDANSKNLIVMEILNLDANVYDYFFIRKLKCNANIELSYFKDNELIKTKTFNSSYSSYEKFAFTPKISFCIKEVLLNSFSQGIINFNFD